MCIKISNREEQHSAMTLVEMMIAMAIGSILLAVLASFIVYTARSFAAMANYAELEYASRNALDRLTYRIRQAQRLASYSPTELKFIDAATAPFNSQPLYYRYDAAEQTLRRVSSGENTVLLTNCTDLHFEIFQRNTETNSYENFPTAYDTPELCKVVQVTWKCSKSLYGTKLFNTEVVQTAKIVIRTK